MKRFFLGLMALVSANCYAENAELDTTKVEQLQEVVVQGVRAQKHQESGTQCILEDG